jgi:hypothetical protein
VARAEAAPRLHEHRVADVAGQVVGQPRGRRADSLLLEEEVRQVLVGAASDRVRLRDEDERAAELAAVLGEHEVIEIGERDDQPDVVQAHEVAERIDVSGIVDTRHERATIGVIQRRCERIDVCRDGCRAGDAEGGDDVDALTRAREQDCGHEGAA